MFKKFYLKICLDISFVNGFNDINSKISGTTDRVISDQDEKLSRTLKHFKEYIHNKFNRYAFGFFFCELLNLLLAFIGFWMTHRFLNDEFLTYGFDVYRYLIIYMLTLGLNDAFNLTSPYSS